MIMSSTTSYVCPPNHNTFPTPMPSANQTEPCTASPNIYPVCITILVTRATSPCMSHACTHMQLVYRHACIPAGKRSAITGASMYVSSVQYISVKECCIANCCYPVAYNIRLHITESFIYLWSSSRVSWSIPQLLHTFSHPFRGEGKSWLVSLKQKWHYK